LVLGTEPADEAPPEPEAVEAPPPDPIERLKGLGELHEQGILTDEEFASEKAKDLAG
jgi:predicted flap endonuclease-1-like 5' DNA nuclease